MPRSYSFDQTHGPVNAPRSRSLRRKDKQHVASSRQDVPGTEGQVHYGRSHAETQQILQARAKHSLPIPPEPAALVEPPVPRPTMPIGALPASVGMVEEGVPRGRVEELLDEASRQLQVLQSGAGDVTRAVLRLAGLPLEMMRMAARRIRPVHG